MKITGDFSIQGVDFTLWFNNFRQSNRELFPHLLNRDNFRKVMACLPYLVGKDAINHFEFVGHFIIIYNETGGKFSPVTEFGGDAYFFNHLPGKKKSYNQKPNRLAGDQLKAWGVISSQTDIQNWNSWVYPATAPEAVRVQARNCDFYKFRGRGLNQVTWRNGYEKYVDPALADVQASPAGAIGIGYHKKSAELTNLELDQAFGNPQVYCSVFRNFTLDPSWCGKAMASLTAGDLSAYPKYVGGFTATAYHQKFNDRAQKLLTALIRSR